MDPSQFDIPGTKYRIQLGLINGKWVSRLLKGNTVIDSYVYKQEDMSPSGFPNQNLIVGWVLRTVAIPNINPHQIMKLVQVMIKQLIGNDGDDRFPHPHIFKPPSPPGDLGVAPRVQVRAPLKENGNEDEINCQYCGRRLTKEEQSTHSCKKKPM